jgi:hypothetical protein
VPRIAAHFLKISVPGSWNESVGEVAIAQPKGQSVKKAYNYIKTCYKSQRDRESELADAQAQMAGRQEDG